MKYGNLTLGQIEAGINIVGGEGGWQKLLKGELKVVPTGDESSVFELTKQHDPEKFYQTKEGLRIWGGFATHILPAAGLTKAGRKFGKVIFHKLTKHTTSEEWIMEHPDSVWLATDFCAWGSIQLTLQSEGQDGSLFNDGNSNLFPVRGVGGKIFVVDVDWHLVGNNWWVDAWPLDSKWGSGDRFFSKPTDC